MQLFAQRTTSSLPWFVCLALIAGSAPRIASAQGGPSRVVVAEARLRNLPDTVTLVGTAEPLTRTVLGSEIAGIVTQMPVRQGDRLEAGQLICKLNDDTLRLQLEREEARLKALQASLEELENGTRKEELARLEAEYAAAEAIAQKWEFELRRVEGLYDAQQAGAKEFQDAQSDYTSAKQQMLAAKAAYDEGLAGARNEQIVRARHEVAVQQAEVKRIRIDLAKTEIRAPYASQVVERLTEVGNWVQTGGSVVEIVDLATVLVRVNVPETAVAYVKPGDRAEIYVDALDETFVGEVRHIIPQADLVARTFPVEIAVDNPEYRLKAGMFCRAKMLGGPSHEIIAVPKDSVVRVQGAAYVAIVEPGQNGQMMAAPTPVTVGLDIDDWLAITSGNIQPGVQVVVRGNEWLIQTMAPAPVEIANAEAANGPSDASPTPAKSGIDEAATKSNGNDPGETEAAGPGKSLTR